MSNALPAGMCAGPDGVPVPCGSESFGASAGSSSTRSLANRGYASYIGSGSASRGSAGVSKAGSPATQWLSSLTTGQRVGLGIGATAVGAGAMYGIKRGAVAGYNKAVAYNRLRKRNTPDRVAGNLKAFRHIGGGGGATYGGQKKRTGSFGSVKKAFDSGRKKGIATAIKRGAQTLVKVATASIPIVGGIVRRSQRRRQRRSRR
jgi:hypothetical protein